MYIVKIPIKNSDVGLLLTDPNAMKSRAYLARTVK